MAEKETIALSDKLRQELISRYKPFLDQLKTDVAFQEDVLVPLLEAKEKFLGYELSEADYRAQVEAAKPAMAAHIQAMQNAPKPNIDDLIEKYGETLGTAMTVDTAFSNFMTSNLDEYCHGLGVVAERVEKTRFPNATGVAEQAEESCKAGTSAIFKPRSR